jgi:TonB family protein
MKANVLWFFLGLGLAGPLTASFESVTFASTVDPQIPAILRAEGMRDARVVLVIDVDAGGVLTDLLVTAASHQELIRPCTEAVRQWRFKPARYEREPVAAQLTLTINLTQTGAVVTRTAAEMVGEWTERLTGRRMDYELCPASAVDRPLVAVARVNPDYARDAESIGIGGRVRVHFFVDEQGAVRMPSVAPSAHPYLAGLATEAMRGWRFEPPTRDGRPVLVAAVQDFDFGSVP